MVLGKNGDRVDRTLQNVADFTDDARDLELVQKVLVDGLLVQIDQVAA